MKFLPYTLVTVTLLFASTSCNHASKDVETVYDTVDTELPALVNDSIALSLVFEGKLPCADCPGIQTRLTLFPDSMRYEMSQLYLEKSKDAVVSAGKYEIVNDTLKSDPTIFHLNPTSTTDSWYFKAVGDSVLTMLDKDMKDIKGTLKYSLKKK